MTNYAAIATGTPPPTFAANNDGRSVEEHRGVAGSVLETYRALIAVRKASPALRRGSYLPVSCPNPAVFAFVRQDAAETVLLAINLDSATASTTLDLGSFGVPAGGAVPVSLETGASAASTTTANRGAYPITLPARGWMIARALIAPPADTSTTDVDGRAIAADAGANALRATQTSTSSFADNAGELNQLFVRGDGDSLRVGITGNIPADGTSLDLFVDIDPGGTAGQSRLVTAHLPSPPGGLAPLDGLAFDAGFRADSLYYVNTIGGSVYVDHVTFAADGVPAAKTYRGASMLNSGRGTLVGGANPTGLEVALDNTNAAGITAVSVAAASTATKGFELRIPYADLGLPPGFVGDIAVTAFIQRNDGVASNQWLPGLAPGSADLGLAPNLAAVSGVQHVVVPIGPPADLDGDGRVTGSDLGALLGAWGPTAGGRAAGDLNADGRVDGADLGLLLASWG